MKTDSVTRQQQSSRVATLPNALSAIRFVLALPLWVLLQQPHLNRWSILALCAAAYLTDIGDGWLARRFHCESSVGRMIDPVADKVYVFVFVLGLLLKGMIPVWFAVVIVARDLLILAGGLAVKARTGVVLPSNWPGKITVIAIAVSLLLAMFGTDVQRDTLLLSFFISFALIVSSLYTYGRRAVRVLSEKKKPVKRPAA
jgi:cardiolipin synthase